MKTSVLINLNRLDEALKAINDALKLSRECPANWCEKGRILLLKGKSEEAINCFNNGIALNPKFIVGIILKVIALLQLNNFKEALITIDNALEQNNSSDLLWEQKGYALPVEESLLCTKI